MNRHCRNSICNEIFQNNVLSNQSNNCCHQVLANTNQCNEEEKCNEEAIREILCRCIGLQCCCEFQIENTLEIKTGILERVGEDHIILRSINNNKFMICDICHLRFVTVTC